MLIKTEKYLIRNLNREDYQQFLIYVKLDGLRLEEEKLSAIFEETLKDDETYGVFVDEEMIATLVASHHFEPLTDCSISFGASVRKDKRNQDIMSEVLGIVCEDYFKNNLTDCIIEACDKTNLASKRVIEKNCFTFYKEENNILYFYKYK